RIDGVIMSQQQVAQFRAVPPVANAVTEKTITTYRTPAAYTVPGGGYAPGVTETVTEKTYVSPSSSTTVVYPDDSGTVTTERVYVTPGGDGNQATTVTRSVTEG